MQSSWKTHCHKGILEEEGIYMVVASQDKLLLMFAMDVQIAGTRTVQWFGLKKPLDTKLFHIARCKRSSFCVLH